MSSTENPPEPAAVEAAVVDWLTSGSYDLDGLVGNLAVSPGYEATAVREAVDRLVAAGRVGYSADSDWCWLVDRE